MNRLLALLALSFCMVCFGQSPQIRSGSTVYIEPMEGYETYLAAALTKKHVPLIVIADKDKAEYIISSNMSHQTPSQPAVVVNNTNINNGANGANGSNTAFENGMQRAEARRAARGSTSASISVIDAQSSQVVFAYSVGKSGNTNQIQSTAEACAKHLKEFIEKPSK